jgi:predicted ArsR family transcriptional regulator
LSKRDADTHDDETWSRVEVLSEPTRRRIFDTVRAARGPVTRENVAQTLGVQRDLAAFHLDRLAEAGLLHVSFARPEGRTGPGAGRPAKHYDATGVSVGMQVPPRSEALVGRLLAQAVDSKGKNPGREARRLARSEGERIGEHERARSTTRRPSLRSVARVLTELGYEPSPSARELRLENCPFHDVMRAAPELVCGMNVELVTGVLSGLGASDDLVAEFAPSPGRCCVVLRRTAAGKGKR